MNLGNPVNIRLSHAFLAQCEAEAKERDMPLSTLLREKLEKSYDMSEEIERLHEAIEKLRIAFEQRLLSDSNSSILIEILLILRQVAQLNKVLVAQAELRRLGFEVWEAKENDES